MSGISRKKIIITGAAGLVGQNLITLLSERNDVELIAIDKHVNNLAILGKLHPRVKTITANLSQQGGWEEVFDQASVVVILHAQITGKTYKPFLENNIKATELVLEQCHAYKVPYLVHASSSVINSVASDDYTQTKRKQEDMVRNSGLEYSILRPTLMFGWFDPKHLGWLARFMEKTPIFPIPGSGLYIRQPLYNRDFCRAIEVCIDTQPANKVYDLVGPEKINYIDMIRTIKHVKGLKTAIVPIPYGLFKILLDIYALFTPRPPFTSDQLKALTAGDEFQGVDMKEIFDFEPTPFEQAIKETFLDRRYSHVVLESYT